MPRIMALDVGEKTVGVAFSDELLTMAFPGATIIRQEGVKRDMAALRQLIADRQVTEIVVGMPLLRDGRRGVQAERVDAFVSRLRSSVRIPIHLQDERYTTGEAEDVLQELGVRRKNHKTTIDSIAACLILKSFLDRTRLAARAAVPSEEHSREQNGDVSPSFLHGTEWEAGENRTPPVGSESRPAAKMDGEMQTDKKQT